MKLPVAIHWRPRLVLGVAVLLLLMIRTAMAENRLPRVPDVELEAEVESVEVKTNKVITAKIKACYLKDQFTVRISSPEGELCYRVRGVHDLFEVWRKGENTSFDYTRHDIAGEEVYFTPYQRLLVARQIADQQGRYANASVEYSGSDDSLKATMIYGNMPTNDGRFFRIIQEVTLDKGHYESIEMKMVRSDGWSVTTESALFSDYDPEIGLPRQIHAVKNTWNDQGQEEPQVTYSIRLTSLKKISSSTNFEDCVQDCSRGLERYQPIPATGSPEARSPALQAQVTRSWLRLMFVVGGAVVLVLLVAWKLLRGFKQ